MSSTQQLLLTEGGGAAPNYIEDVFSTYLYTGNGTSQTITNNIDLSTKGGLVWVKSRVSTTYNHRLQDTVRGVNSQLFSNTTGAATTSSTTITAFNTDGFSVGDQLGVNEASATYASWTFRKQPKFFDVVTYTGNGATQNISHNLGATPGCIIVKRTDAVENWGVYHRSIGNTGALRLNQTSATSTLAAYWNNTSPTSTQFTVGSDTQGNASGGTYVAYLFAHDAGGFGLTGTDNVISCGSFTNAGADLSVSLGYEPQWIIIKKSDSTGSWGIFDTMRGIVSNSTVVSNNDATLFANTSDAEAAADWVGVNSTGFDFKGSNFGGGTFIYVAIRRGPMKIPTDATKVFGLNARTGTGAVATVTGGQVADAVLIKNRGSAVADLFSSRQTGTGYLITSASNAEAAGGTTILQTNPWDVMDGVKVGTSSTITNASGNTFINYLFQRAPSFFDEVCYTGTGTARTVTHNLGAVPELMIVKCRNDAQQWEVYSTPTGITKFLVLNQNYQEQLDYGTFWNNTTPTSSVFSLGNDPSVNGTGAKTYVAYLFATCAGVSKVGSYTGTGATQTISCGFAGGARYVLIKRTDSTGNWYFWDTARGMVAGTDPKLAFNLTTAETNANWVYTTTGGFQIVTTDASVNASGGSYIFLAIA